ncbi:DMT family transporter [Sphingomonas sp.]|uniref:DMT family transporter n=1 Tax=Sphingomonas sp. TaxID=28214 RepID=UPI003CC615B1
MHQAEPPRKAVAPSSALPLAAVVVANVALAFGPWFVRLADTGPVAAGFWRLALGAPFLAGLALATGARPVRLDRWLWWALAGAGLSFAADIASWHLGILRTTLANATLFGNSATLIFPVYGFAVARAWPTRGQGLAFALALAGAALLMGRSYQLDAKNLAGDLLCLAAGVLYTVYFILMARARETMAPLSALALSTVASVLPLLVVALALGERVWPHSTLGDWLPLIGLALVSQVIGQGCMIYALGRLPPLVVGLALLVQPVVAAAIGWLRYGERLGPVELTGAALIAVALVLVRRATPVAPAGPRAH